MLKTVGILVPTAKPRIKGIPANPRFHDLDGKVVGFLWNEKPNGDILLRRIRDRLMKRYTLIGTNWGQGGKAYEEASTVPAVNQLATSSDLVIIAIADWGGCTTWCIHAAVALEKRGKPTVIICTNRFEFLARATSVGLGINDPHLVVVPHPIGGISPEEVITKADKIIENITE